ncbi:MAG: hypothetical protein KBH06_03330 [Spirochaetes bacterium]|nr:hypothetical protein [Spirochaetota bacterium]
MNVLFIEDEPSSVEPAKDLLEKNNIKTCVINFPDDSTPIKDFNPDCIVLDRMQGMEDNEGNGGEKSLKIIREFYFCPIVIYSGASTKFGNEHPLITCVLKGRDSEEKVYKAIRQFTPLIIANKEIFESLSTRTREMMRDTFPIVHKEGEIDETKIEIFKYLTNRRIAASIDIIQNQEGRKLNPVEMYIYPPIKDSFLVCDIIKKNSDLSTMDVCDYRMILTPSCDLEANNNRKEKIEFVLTAKLARIDEDTSQWTTGCSEEKRNKFIKQYLDNPESKIFLPAIPNVIGHWHVEFKKLELVSYTELKDVTKWKRVVSIDSPFREQIVWEFTKEIGRPGLPDRNFVELAEKFIKSRKAE